MPTILLIFLFGFGIPALRISGVPTVLVWGTVALICSYSAYVAEVFRAGIDSVHPSQRAAARSLGLRRADHALRGPAAGGPPGRPAAAERLHLAAEGHRARLGARPDRGAAAAQIDASFTFNYTAYVVAALMFIALTIPMARFTDWLLGPAPAASAGGRRRDDERPAARSRGPEGVRRPPVLRGIDLEVARARGRLPDRRLRARASRRCCAASTCSRTSTPGRPRSTASR